MHIQSIVIKMSLILWESLRSSNMRYSWTNEMEISNKVLKWYESSKTTYISNCPNFKRQVFRNVLKGIAQVLNKYLIWKNFKIIMWKLENYNSSCWKMKSCFHE